MPDRERLRSSARGPSSSDAPVGFWPRGLRTTASRRVQRVGERRRQPCPCRSIATGRRAKPQRAQQIEEAGEARVFDRDEVARPQARLQGPLDPVEGAADHRQVLGVDPGRAELGRGRARAAEDLPGRRRRAGAAAPFGAGRGQIRQQLRVGVAAGQVADARRHAPAQPGAGNRRPPADVGAAARPGHDQAARAQVRQGGGDGPRADAELGGERAHRRQRRSGRSPPVSIPRSMLAAISAAPSPLIRYCVIQ